MTGGSLDLSAGFFVRGVAVVAALAAVAAARQRRRDTGSRRVHVAMEVKKAWERDPTKEKKKFTWYEWYHYIPVKKGGVRKWDQFAARFWNRELNKHFLKKYGTTEGQAELVRKWIYGSQNIFFETKHMSVMPKPPVIFPYDSRQRPSFEMKSINEPRNTLWERVFERPAKFKKLPLYMWEMKEEYERVCTLKDLVDNGLQYGHTTPQWNQKMLQYLYADHDGTHIFDLVQTSANLNRACYFVQEAARLGAKFMFVGTKPQAQEATKLWANKTGSNYNVTRYVGGLFTNFYQVQHARELLARLEDEYEQGLYKRIPAKIRVENIQLLGELAKKYDGVQDMEWVPDIVIFVDEKKEHYLKLDCLRMGIPTVGLCDSDSDPTDVDFVIPGNAASSTSIAYVLEKLGSAIELGHQQREADKEAGTLEDIPDEWDPWMFQRNRNRRINHSHKRQPMHKMLWGGYEQWKKAHPFGEIPDLPAYTAKVGRRDERFQNNLFQNLGYLGNKARKHFRKFSKMQPT